MRHGSLSRRCDLFSREHQVPVLPLVRLGGTTTLRVTCVERKRTGYRYIPVEVTSLGADARYRALDMPGGITCRLRSAPAQASGCR